MGSLPTGISAGEEKVQAFDLGYWAFATALIACYLSFVSAANALLMLSILPICRFSLQSPIAVAVLKFDPT